MEVFDLFGTGTGAAVITVNLSAEFFWLALDPGSIKRPKTLSMGEYGMSRGLDRVLEVLDEYGLKATFFCPGLVAERYGDRVREIAAAGHEIALFGYGQENMALLTPDEQREVIKKGMAAITAAVGVAPRGFRSPMGELTEQTLLIAKEEGIVYSSSIAGDDRPYMYPLPGGEQLLEIPVHFAMYDLPYFAFNYTPAFPAGQGRIAPYSAVLQNWKLEYTGYHNRGLCYVLQVDPQTIGTPGRIGLLRELLEHIKQSGSTWHATCGEVHDRLAK